MAGTLVSVVGLNKILEKLDAKKLTGPSEAQLFHDAATEGRDFLAGKLSERFPATSNHVIAESTPAQGKISAPRYPYVFFERGSQYPRAGRLHRRRTGVKNSALRIRPRRFLSQTRSKIRRDLTKHIIRMKAEIERVWSA